MKTYWQRLLGRINLDPFMAELLLIFTVCCWHVYVLTWPDPAVTQRFQQVVHQLGSDDTWRWVFIMASLTQLWGLFADNKLLRVLGAVALLCPLMSMGIAFWEVNPKLRVIGLYGYASSVELWCLIRHTAHATVAFTDWWKKRAIINGRLAG